MSTPTKTTKTFGRQLEQAVNDYDVEAVRKLMAQPGANKIVKQKDLLGQAIWSAADDESQRLAVVRELLKAQVGFEADLDQPAILGLPDNEADEPAQLVLLRELLDHGADPNTRGRAVGWIRPTLLGKALARGSAQLVAELVGRGVRDETRLEALLAGLAAIADAPRKRERVRVIIVEFSAHVASLDRCGEGGLAPLHAAALAADAQVFAALLARARPDVGVANDVRVPVGDAIAPGEVVVPQLTIHTGETARDIAEKLLAMLNARQAAPESPKTPADQSMLDRYRGIREPRITALATILAGLPADNRVAKRARLPQPPYKAEIDGRLARLDVVARLELGSVRRNLEELDATDLGPWGYLSEALSSLKRIIDFDRLGDGLFVRVARGQGFQGPGRPANRPSDLDEDSFMLRFADYPAEARPGLKNGHIFAASDADLYFLWPRDDGPTRVCHAHPEGFWVLADSIPEFVERELATLSIGILG